MQEPEYIFVKGQGWILGNPNEEVSFANKYGKGVLINRKPKYGEYVAGFTVQDAHYINGDKVDLNKLATYITKNNIKLNDYSVYTEQSARWLDRFVLCVMIWSPHDD